MENNNKGFVYVTVSIVLAMIFIMYGTLLSNVSRAINAANSYGEGLKAYYMAESGAAYAIDYIISNRAVIAGYRGATRTNTDNLFTEPDYVGDYSVKWELLSNTANTTYRFRTTGNYKNYLRNIEILIEFQPSNKFIIKEWKTVTV